ncbi:MAG: COX15/CtaA family protein [Rhodospirillaceae bacterium]|nr:COX15/CtaA family protein [Rhodospirillaceae bacterium]
MSPASAPSSQVAPQVRYRRAIAWWLIVCAAMVFAMVMLGGATRLTESGLSMVHWKPLTVMPPLNDAEWQTEFQNYQRSPQFQKENSWMTVDDFKNIYWLEFLHRLWGRIIGVAFAVPFAFFLVKRAVDRTLGWKLTGLFVLGGAQGALGWFMVASGLVDRPDVSQYRLAAHLLTALVLYVWLIWTALDLFRADKPTHHGDRALAPLAFGLMAATFLVIASGAFVAGLDAGLIYNTFPLMDGRLIPTGLGQLEPWYLNPFENVTAVQFQHRVLAVALVLFTVFIWLRARRFDLSASARTLTHAVLAMALLQAVLGISTLLLVVPILLALAHQTGALTLLTLALCLTHTVRPRSTAEINDGASLSMKPAE